MLESLRAAETRGRTLYAKEHVAWLLAPDAEEAVIHGGDAASEEAGPWGVSGERRSAGNETCLPDALLRRVHPTFLVRHPALAFPSALRTSLSSEGASLAGGGRGERERVADIVRSAPWELSFHWSRALFDWYVQNLSVTERRTPVDGVVWPVLIDADDITDKALIEKYCKVSGLDSSKVRWEWDAVDAREREKLSGVAKKMTATIIDSTGVVPRKTAEGLVVEVEKVKWIQEFGEELAEMLATHVGNAMADYQYLRQKSLKSSS